MDDKTMDDVRMDEQEETKVKTTSVVDVEENNGTSEDDVLMEDIKAKKYDAVDIVKLLDLLKASKKAGDLIAEKHVMLLIGLTGAGKTTSTLYLAGAKFEEEVIDGYPHYKPIEIPNEALSEFAVSGGATSVTTTIQATTIVLKGDENAQEERITICDTPGFGDSKGAEQDISNGLGIVHALKGAASIKPVIVMDHRSMDGGRWLALRKNLSTVIAMMGRESIDFSPFSYVFTRCEGKSKKRISEQLQGFQNAVRKDPLMKDKDILDALLSDMISKTKPGDVICIDPEEPDDAPDTLKRLWRGSRIDNPGNRFANFCSKESMAALSTQVNILIQDVEKSLKISDLDSALESLRKMTEMAEALSLSNIDNAVDHGITKAKDFVNQLSFDIEDLVTRIDSDFQQNLNSMSSKLHLLSKSESIRKICDMDFNYSVFINDITRRLLSIVEQPIADISPTIPGSENVLQRSITRFALIVKSFQGIIDNETIETGYSIMIKATKHLTNPIMDVLGNSLNISDPKSTTLNECLPKLNFVLAMDIFFHSSKFASLNMELSKWTSSFETELKNILQNINDISQTCVTHIEELDKALHEELLGEVDWSYSSILKLKDIAEKKEYRDFLQAMLSSDSLVTSIQNDTNPDLKSLIRDFDDAVRKYVPNLVFFLQGESQAVFDNETRDTADRVNKAHTIIDSVDLVLGIANTLKDLDTTIFQKALEELNDVKSRSKHFIDESKKAPIRHKIRRGKTLEPTEEELAKANNKRDKRYLLGWYGKCNELKIFWKKHGHCDVPRKDPKLGLWVKLQRQEKIKFEAGSKTAMTDEKLQHLSGMDFQWSVMKERNNAVWDQRYKELREFKEEKGHCRVPQGSSGKLGIWATNMRSTARRPKNKEKIDKLEAIGFFDS